MKVGDYFIYMTFGRSYYSVLEVSKLNEGYRTTDGVDWPTSTDYKIIFTNYPRLENKKEVSLTNAVDTIPTTKKEWKYDLVKLIFKN
jgi:hypothetical protein